MSILYRAGTHNDNYAIFYLFEQAIADLVKRFGSTEPTSIADADALAKMWEERRSLYRHLTDHATHFYVAEQEGQIIGFARSILRDGLRELTEFFVAPQSQSLGVGRNLIQRVFPNEGENHRAVIATADLRAQATYLKLGMYPRFPIYYFGKQAEQADFTSDLAFIPMTEAHAEVLAEIDKTILGHRRDVEHAYLQSARQGFVYTRQGQPVGYGYLGSRNGPFALLDSADFAAVLAHGESIAAEHQRDFGVEVPTINHAAVEHLIARNFTVDTFLGMFMSNVPFGKFENYLVTSPPFFL